MLPPAHVLVCIGGILLSDFINVFDFADNPVSGTCDVSSSYGCCWSISHFSVFVGKLDV